MIVDKYGRVAGSIDLAALAHMYAQSEDDDLRVHYRQVAADNGLDLGEDSDGWLTLDARGAVEAIERLSRTAEEVDAEEREDGVYGVGGGWHEVVIGGEVIDKVRGADAAQEAYEAYQEANSGDD